MRFPEGTSTPSEVCGGCHKAIYKEFAFGFGGDITYQEMSSASVKNKQGKLSPTVPAGATAHAIAGMDPFPMHAREKEEGGRSCNVCHFPEAFSIADMAVPEMTRPRPRPKDKEMGGLTCASCHLTPQGVIRSAHAVQAPHKTVEEPAIQTSAMCAYCHSMGTRVVGKQTQTFLEWREDFFGAGLGKQQCQDCHMPRTLRKVAEDAAVPERAVARHLWTGGRSKQRLSSALSLVASQPGPDQQKLEFHVINIGAGHSVPTGSNRRAIYLIAEAVDEKGKTVDSREWMFAPSYGSRPDDKKYLNEDKTRPDAIAAAQADSQGPHEAIIRAGEERIVPWTPMVVPGTYTVRARLVYDLNRYNERSLTEDQSEMNRTSLTMVVKKSTK
jgi:hypothetical protein